MSTIKVDNIRIASESVSRPVTGVAAAWVNFNGTGTPAIQESMNVGSITDIATGIYQANFSSNMSNQYYVASLGSYSMVYDQGTLQDDSTPTYVGIKIQDGQTNDFIDSLIVSAALHGDLA